MQLFSERFEGLFTQARRLSILAWSRPERDEQLVLLAVGEEFHFVAEALEAGLCSNACDRGDRLFEKGSGDRTMGYRQQVVRSSPAIAQRDAGPLHHVQANAVAIAPGRPCQAADLGGDRDVRSRQRLLQNVELHLQLKGRAGVLVLAAAAAGNIFAAGYDPLRRGLEDGIEFTGREAAAVRGDAGFYQFAGQRSRNKDRLAAGCGLIRRNARQAVAAIDRLLDAQLHAWLI